MKDRLGFGGEIRLEQPNYQNYQLNHSLST